MTVIAPIPQRADYRGTVLRILLPILVGIAFLALWQFLVGWLQVPKFVLPKPTLIWTALIANFWSLMGSLWFTLTVTIEAFVLAVVGGVALAVLFSQSEFIATAFFPYAVILQVTPVVSIAPLIIIWVGYDNVRTALLILAWIVAFFPVLSNTTLGLRSTDHNLRNLMQLYGASRWRILTEIQFPSAMPYLLAGMKISGGLSLIGAVVAEFVAGSGTSTGLAWRIIESGNRLDIPRMFAALGLLSFLGIAIFGAMSAIEYLLLRHWHESAVRREN
ncbi:ABC transporter permease [Acidisoma cladoniae]|jgi:NitT/TauT family transport system permease protein|uniref:ABC transporter permease n=1 Tax=Acidisoma cladoniae TaxID=3040935 RepID=UPI00254A4E9A|nr:ABC transporter permease [Acidisoma sp. PAMC 29798]